jgi:hypothetical protein
MGGLGSGRRSSYGGKPETGDSMPLDLRLIARRGLLIPGNRFSSHWRVNGQESAGITIAVEDVALVLSYRRRGIGDLVEQRVNRQSSPCHLGGSREWLICPRCGKRVAVLYAPGQYFACRQCGGLAYATQKKGAGDRASSKANKIRRRLGWPAGILNDAGGKPKGMHWATYRRLTAEHDALSQVCFEDIGRKLGIVRRMLGA